MFQPLYIDSKAHTLVNESPKTLADLPPLKTTIDQYGLSARKALGQHFLLDSRITDRIVRHAGDVRSCHVIEVGPGPGGLTRSLLAAGAQVTAVEKDDRCIAALTELQGCSEGRLQIVHGDAMTYDPVSETPAPRKIIANLPYNVGTAMLLNWLDAIDAHGATAYASLTLMFQKEVAERIVAEPGNKDFGRLSVLCQWLCECRWDMELPPGAFSPPPKVSSAVVTLTPRAIKTVNVKKENLELVVGAAFGQRRKMLRSALKGLPVAAEALLENATIDGSKRAEQLSVAELCHLAQAFENMRK